MILSKDTQIWLLIKQIDERLVQVAYWSQKRRKKRIVVVDHWSQKVDHWSIDHWSQKFRETSPLLVLFLKNDHFSPYLYK